MKFKKKTFGFGGIYIDKRKLTDSIPFTKTHIPFQIRLPMSQDSGKPARTIVEAGQYVEEGQIIGEAADADSAYIHTSVSGRVVSVERGRGFGQTETNVVTIETGGIVKNWYGKKYEIANMTPEQMVKEIMLAGIVGLGGMFDCLPVQTKLVRKEGKKADTLIVNAAESGPYLTSEHRLMIEKTGEVIEGIIQVMKIIGAPEAIIGIEENKADAAEAILSKLGDHPGIRVEVLRSKYPQDGERELIFSLLKKEVPAGWSPINMGVVVENVSTIFAIYEALVYKKPLIERYMTYSGENVEKRGNYKVRIGTPIRLILEEFGLPESFGAVISGDPLTGIDIKDLNTPVMKNTAAIIILSKPQNYRVLNRPCIRCSKCLSSCPMRLNPAVLARLCGEENINEAAGLGLTQCIECGCCSYSCPSTIPITGLIRYGKKILGSPSREGTNGRN